jgi:hypothetical protein
LWIVSRFQHPPGVGQNIAWALTEELNISRIIDDLWYRDIRLVCIQMLSISRVIEDLWDRDIR